METSIRIVIDNGSMISPDQKLLLEFYLVASRNTVTIDLKQ